MTDDACPSGWVKTCFGEVFKVRGGSQPPKSTFVYKPTNDYIRLLQIRDFGKKPVPTYVRKDSVTKFCVEDDILIARYGASLGRILSGMAGAYNVALAKMIFDRECLDPKYVFNYLNTTLFQTPLSMMSRSAQNGFSEGELHQFVFPLPPLNEQKRIVEKIEELFSELDAGEASLRLARHQLSLYRQSLLKQAFEGKLTAPWREQNPLKEWENTTLENLTDYITSGSRGWANYYSDSGDLFIRAQNLSQDTLDLTNIAYVRLPEKSEGKRTLIQKGDLLVTITGANTTKTGWVSEDIGTAYVSQHVALCRLLQPECAEYLYYFLICPSHGRKTLEDAAYGAGKPGLNLSNLKSLEIPLPSLPEQQEIVRLLEAQFEVITQNEREIDAALKRSQALRQSILKKAFSGRLVPQDPTDEPATTLLARIQAQRAAATPKKSPKKKSARKKTKS